MRRSIWKYGRLGALARGASHIVEKVDSDTSTKVQIVTVDGTVAHDRKVGIIQLDVEVSSNRR